MKADRLEFELCKGRSAFLLSLTDRVLNTKRISLTALASAAMTAALALNWGSSDATAPLVIFSGLITLLFLALLLYVCRTKPKIRRQIHLDEEQGGAISFGDESFTLTLGGKTYPDISLRDIRGQYWSGENYALYVDHDDLKSMICIAVDAGSFDDLYALAQRLVRRKIKFVQVKQKSNGQGG